VDRLKGKVAIITGAGSGIGRESARIFAAEGAAVVCTDINSAAAEETAETINAAGDKAVPMAMDVTSPEDNESMASLAIDQFGRIDALYANAGIAGVGSIESTSIDVWDQVIAVNLTGVWLSNRAVLPAMMDQGGGSIVNQASIGGLIGVQGIAPYAAAKAGVIGLTKQAAVEYGPHNIRFNAVCPGTVPTPLVTRTYEQRGGMGGRVGQTVEEGLASMSDRYPMQRLGTLAEVANLALFLASDEASWMTGAIIPVDGGFTAA
jgi:NAD(P)-dependent dehydrogenase (short-subunit alcohol dehydrogenase family)